MPQSFGTHHRNLVLVLLGFFVCVELPGVSFLTGCSRRVGSSQVLVQRNIRKDVLAEKAKSEVNASDLPPEIKSEVNQRIDQVPVAGSDRDQILAIVNELVKALKDGKATPAQLTTLAVSAVDKLSELNTDDPGNGLLPMLQRPEIAEAIKILTREGLPEEEILKAVLHQTDPSLVTNPQASAVILQNPLFSNFSQGSKTAVLAASGDPDAQRQSEFASAVTEAIEDQGFPLAVASALQLSVVNAPPKGAPQADAEAILVALNEEARSQSLEPASRTELLLNAVDAILGTSSSFTTAEAEQLFKTTFGILTESGVSGAAIVSASIARLPAERRDSATEIDALLASSLYDAFSPEVRAEAKDVLYKQYVPAPTDITLSSSILNENAGANGFVGTLSTAHVDAGNTFTYTLVTGTGSTDNASFNISTNSLHLTVSADFETKSSYSVRIRSTNNEALFFEKAFTITINDVNEAPTDISLSSSSLNENAGANAAVGTLSSVDADAGNAFTYTLVAGTGDTDNAAFNISSNSLRLTANADFETKSSYSVRVRTTDSGGLFFEKAFAISILNVNEAPTISLISDQVTNEDGSLSGIAFTVNDPDSVLTCSGSVSAGSSNVTLLPVVNAVLSGTAPSCLLAVTPVADKNGTSTVTLTVSDSVLSNQTSFLLTVSAANDAPVISVAGDTTKLVAQDVPTAVTLATATDPDVASNGQSLSYFISQAPTHGSLGTLPSSGVAGGTVTYTPQSGYVGSDSFSYQICDSFGTPVCTALQTVSITVTDVNEAPTDISLSASSLNENAGANGVVGTLSSVDPDAGNTFTYTLVAGTGSTDNAAFNISTNSLRLTASADFETKSSYSVRIRSTDNGSAFFEKAFTITINDVNEAPTDITLSSSSLNENAGANGVVGTLSTVDVDAGSTFTYTLVAGSGDTDNASFNISASSLRLTASADFETKSNYSVRIRSTDNGTLVFEKVFAITINDVNEAPTDINLSSSSLNENAGANSVVGTLSTADVDSGSTFTYTLVAGSGDTDNASFNINANSLRLTASADFETKSSYTVRIRSTDNGALFSENAFTITINDVNEAPTDITLSASTLNENAGANAAVGTLSSVDADSANTFSYTLVAGAGDTDNASFNISTNSLRLTASANFETKSSYSVRIRSTDNGTLVFEKAFTITINDVNEAPTDITLSASNLNENAGANGVVGTLSTADVDASSTFTYTLVTGSGDTDNASFNISTNSLRLTASADFETMSIYSVRIRSTDNGALIFEKAFTITINDVLESTWYSEAYIKAANTEASDYFGSAVSLSGESLAVGAYQESEDSSVIVNGTTAPNLNGAGSSGGVYVYRRTGVNWTPEAYIKAANAAPGDHFGRAVALAGDSLAVTAPLEDENSSIIVNGTTAPNLNGATDSGAVYVYRRTGVSWAQEAYIKTANAEAGDYFGWSVRLSGDSLAVAAPLEDENSSIIVNGTTAPNLNGATDSGAVYVFRRTGVSWAQEAYIKAANAFASDQFGRSVSLSGDTLAAGAFQEDENSSVIVNGTTAPNLNGATDSGAVYVFRRTGVSWAPEAYIKAANAETNDYFGRTVSLSGDTLAVGTYQEDESSSVIVNGNTAPNLNGATDSGAVYVYRRTGGSWAPEAYIKPANAEASDYFGIAISLSGDTLAVGASQEDENSSVIVNGTTAPNNNGASQAGAVYVYRRTGANWAPEAYIKAANAQTLDYFGGSISLSGDTLAVGAFLEDENSSVIVNGTTAPNLNGATDSGAVYVYRNLNRLFDPPELVANSSSTTSFTVSWLNQNRGLGNGTYKVVYDTNAPAATCTTGTVAHNGTGTTATVSSGLTPGQTYYVRVCQTDGSNWSEGTVSRVTVKGEDTPPTIISINRGSSSNPVAPGTGLIDFVVTFNEAVAGLNSNNFSFVEAGTNKGATGTVSSIACSGAICTIWVAPERVGILRMDLSNPVSITDTWGNALATTRNGDQTYTLQGWYPEAYIKAANAEGGDWFGYSVSVSGDTLAAGANLEDENSSVIVNGATAPNLNGLTFSGAVYVYRRTGISWAPEAYIKAANASTDDLFGRSVSLSGDTLAVGARREDENTTVIVNGPTAPNADGASDSGAVYVYRRSGVTWAPEAYIKAANASVDDWFGHSLSLSGNTLAIGAYLEDENSSLIVNGSTAPNANGATGSGAVYVYRRTGVDWSPEAYIKAANVGANDEFGRSVSLSGDTLAVGAYREDENSTVIVNGTTAPNLNGATDSGAVYIYRRTGVTWTQEAYIKAANASASDEFGTTVSLSGDTLAVGASLEDESSTIIVNGTTAPNLNGATDSGAVYVYRRTGGSWAPEAYIKAANAEAGDLFGDSVSLSGHTLAVGAHLEDENRSVIVNGTTAPNLNGANNSGAVYVFRRTGSTWIPEAYIKSANGSATDFFGSSVSLSGDSLAAGALNEDENSNVIVNGPTAPNANGADASGAAYVYRNTDNLADPDVRVTATTTTSISFAWGGNLGPTGAQIIVAPAATGTAAPAACQLAGGGGSLTLTAGVTTYTYSGLTAGSKYGFRLCSTDGTEISGGTTLWFETAP